jgi:hypothetical protein
MGGFNYLFVIPSEGFIRDPRRIAADTRRVVLGHSFF